MGVQRGHPDMDGVGAGYVPRTRRCGTRQVASYIEKLDMDIQLVGRKEPGREELGVRLFCRICRQFIAMIRFHGHLLSA